MPQATDLKFSIIIPVYNRPQETDELLQSLSVQSDKDYEVIVIEDGSDLKCEEQVKKYTSLLSIKYFYKHNSGPGLTRNFGFEKASGNYGIFLDSDCILPEQYINVVKKSLQKNYADAFGGPDKASDDFTVLQKAINYSMTSFLTTGGIRGGGEKLDKFYPRSFNMGYSREVFNATKGFAAMRFGEDIDMSIRIIKNNFTTTLISEAYVYHKRRTSLKQFFKQVYNSGVARINLYKRHPASLKIVHSFPSLFLIGFIGFIVLSVIFSSFFLIPLLLFVIIFFTDALVKSKNFLVAANAVATSFIQLISYGAGFIFAFIKRIIFKQEEFAAFKNTFYK